MSTRTIEDLAREDPRAAEVLAIAIFRRLSVKGAHRITLTNAELLEANAFQLVGDTFVEGQTVTFKLERKVKTL